MRLLLFLVLSRFVLAAPLLINGTGASFPYPLYLKWVSHYRTLDPEVAINYQSIGSGGGIQQFLKRTTDFGASDFLITDKDLSKDFFQLPTTLGGVAISYNLPELEQPLNLSPEVLSEIFLNKIKKWDDPKIKALNPNLKLPEKTYILPCHRSDGSGTTAIFTAYLATGSKDWKSSKDAKFTSGLGAKGNEGVMGLLRQNPGAIGYVEMNFAISNHFPMAALKNNRGNFVVPSIRSVEEAAKNAKLIDPEVINKNNLKAYPLASLSYVFIWKTMDKEKGPHLVRFLKWAVSEGQEMSATLNYAHLPKGLTTEVIAALNTIQFE